jgi:hypothetical protein
MEAPPGTPVVPEEDDAQADAHAHSMPQEQRDGFFFNNNSRAQAAIGGRMLRRSFFVAHDAARTIPRVLLGADAHPRVRRRLDSSHNIFSMSDTRIAPREPRHSP